MGQWLCEGMVQWGHIFVVRHQGGDVKGLMVERRGAVEQLQLAIMAVGIFLCAGQCVGE